MHDPAVKQGISVTAIRDPAVRAQNYIASAGLFDGFRA